MDDTQTQQPSVNPTGDAMSSMNDVAGMTPPPAPVMPTPATDPMSAAPAAPMSDPMPAAPKAEPAAGDDEYSYAEDVLNEILDSLDRIETKLEAMEKKLG